MYRPGRINPADALSRHPLHRLAAVSVVQTAPELLQRFVEGYEADPLFQPVKPTTADSAPVSADSAPVRRSARIRASSRIGSPSTSGATMGGQPRGPPGCHKQGGLWYKEVDGVHRICVPSDSELRQMVLRESHDSAIGGHFGRDKPLWRVEQTYAWPSLAADVAEYVRSCDQCQRNKPLVGKTRGLLQPLQVPSDRWEEVSLDYITGLPRTKDGHDVILVIVDRLSKWAYFIPTVITANAKETARLFMEHVLSRHGMPKRLVSDRDTRFTSQFWRALFEAMGSTLGMSTAYHPQTDGQTERVNRVLEEALRAYVGAMQTDWDRQLPMVQFAYNTAKHVSTGETAFFLNYGRHPVVPASLWAVPAAD